MPTSPRRSAAPKPATSSRTWDVGVFLTAKYLLTAEQFAAAIEGSAWDHYVYGLCLDNGAVFYVGKGIRSRALDHEKQAAQGEQSEKCEYIRAIGQRLRYTLFFQCADDAYAKGYEAYLIRGHHDVLTNIVIPSTDAIYRMCEPVDPFAKEFEALRYVDEYIKRADRECRESMRDIIEGCPSVIHSLTDDTLAWVTGLKSGSAARAAIQRQLVEAQV